MPARARTTTAPPPLDEAVEATLVDALADDPGLLTEYPPGTPELVPFLQLRPRSRRSAFKRKFAEFTAIEDKIKALKGRAEELAKNTDVSPELSALRMRLSADVDDMYQVMDEVLEAAAADPAAWRVWSDELEDDNDLARVFQLYMARSQPGEASSSTS